MSCEAVKLLRTVIFPRSVSCEVPMCSECFLFFQFFLHNLCKLVEMHAPKVFTIFCNYLNCFSGHSLVGSPTLESIQRASVCFTVESKTRYFAKSFYCFQCSY